MSLFSSIGSAVGSVFGGSAGSVLGSIGGSILDNNSVEKASKLDWQRQKEMAQNSIQWRTEDAKKAGLHPLYALGAPAISYSSTAQSGGGYGDAVRHLGNAYDKARSDEANASYQKQFNDLTLENMRLQNQQIDAQTKTLLAEAANRAKNSLTGVGKPRPVVTAVDPSVAKSVTLNDKVVGSNIVTPDMNVLRIVPKDAYTGKASRKSDRPVLRIGNYELDTGDVARNRANNALFGDEVGQVINAGLIGVDMVKDGYSKVWDWTKHYIKKYGAKNVKRSKSW